MEHVVVAEKRTETGKGPNNRLRRSGMLPAVMYGHDAPVHVSLNERDFMREFKELGESTIVTLTVAKKKYSVLIKDYQEDVISGRLLHVDFFEVEAGKKLRTHVGLHLAGTPVEIREGGILENPVHEIEIECLPKDLVDYIEVDISGLTSEHALHVGDIPAPKGIKILTKEDVVVAAIVHHKETVESETEEEAEVEGAAQE